MKVVINISDSIVSAVLKLAILEGSDDAYAKIEQMSKSTEPIDITEEFKSICDTEWRTIFMSLVIAASKSEKGEKE